MGNRRRWGSVTGMVRGEVYSVVGQQVEVVVGQQGANKAGNSSVIGETRTRLPALKNHRINARSRAVRQVTIQARRRRLHAFKRERDEKQRGRPGGFSGQQRLR